MSRPTTRSMTRGWTLNLHRSRANPFNGSTITLKVRKIRNQRKINETIIKSIDDMIKSSQENSRESDEVIVSDNESDSEFHDTKSHFEVKLDESFNTILETIKKEIYSQFKEKERNVR